MSAPGHSPHSDERRIAPTDAPAFMTLEPSRGRIRLTFHAHDSPPLISPCVRTVLLSFVLGYHDWAEVWRRNPGCALAVYAIIAADVIRGQEGSLPGKPAGGGER